MWKGVACEFSPAIATATTAASSVQWCRSFVSPAPWEVREALPPQIARHLRDDQEMERITNQVIAETCRRVGEAAHGTLRELVRHEVRSQQPQVD